MRKESLIQIKILPVIMVFCLILAGCGKTVTNKPVTDKPAIAADSSQQEQQSSETPIANTSLQILRKVHSETLRDDDGTALLTLKITFPEIKNPGNDSGIAKINEYYGVQFDDFISNIITQGQEMARDDKEAAQSSGYEFHPHAYERSAEIYYNGNNLLSVQSLQYENTGGAHPNSLWLSETFDVKTGKKLALTDVLGGSKEEALAKVYQTVLSKIKATEGTNDFVYQESYPEDVRKNYDEDDFVLTGNSLMFYYQLYAIAPYAAGFPKFELPYNQMKTPAFNLPELPKNQLERDVYDQAGKLIDRNKEAYFDIFGLSMLKMDIPEKHAEAEVLFPVTDDRFASYDDLEQFVRGTYIKSEADSLLGNGRYRDLDGKLYGDISKDTGMGYNVDWNDYSYKIDDLTGTSASLHIFTTDDSPAGQKDTTITALVQKENGVWLLKKIVD